MHEMVFILGGHSPAPTFVPREIFPNLISKDPRDNKHWPSSRSERRQHRRIVTWV